MALTRRNKKPRGRRKKQENTQSVPEELNSNKHVYAVLEFTCKDQDSKSSGCKEDKENNERPCRRSQRIKLKELKRPHFLFQEPPVRTPVNKREEVVLAYETPDHELLMIAKKRQSKFKQMQII